MASANPAAQLMQLGQAKFIRSVDQNGVGVGHINTRLDNRRAHQHVKAFVVEVAHHGFQFPFAHLAVADDHPGFRNQFAQALSRALNGFDVVVQVIHLSAAQQLTQDRFFDQRQIKTLDKGFDR